MTKLLEIPMNGIAVLHDPFSNKGLGFTEDERDTQNLRGLLPPRILSLEAQAQRILENFYNQANPLQKYVYLMALAERNKTLFYRVVLNNLEEMMPIIYTPTVGQACQEYGHIFQRPQGLFVSINDKGRAAELVNNWYSNDVRVVVITDGERILGLGDLGANGMGIPVGKLALYTALAGIDPEHTLPIVLDVGTNNETLRQDPYYIGIPQPRVSGMEYDELIAELFESILNRWPNAVIQFEDFANHNAFRLLEHYRDRICTFNDDIQGTGAVALAGIYGALRMINGKLSDQRLLFQGAGEAGIGIANLIVSAMMDEGMSEQEARARCWFIDSTGLVVASRHNLAEHKLPYAHDHAPIATLLDAVQELKPTALIGVSSQPQTFTEEIIKAMGEINERPIVFALSNPTSKSECSAQQAYSWTDGRVVFASGSPFPTLVWDGKEIHPGQVNNAYIFPGLGLGVVAVNARHVTDAMFAVAARTLAEQTDAEDFAVGRIFPSFQRIRAVSLAIAMAVAQEAYRSGLARVPRPADLKAHIAAQVYEPKY